MIAGLRLAVSLLTIVPVRGTDTVDRRRAGWAMMFAPLVHRLAHLLTEAARR